MNSTSSNPSRTRRVIEFFTGNRRKSVMNPRDIDELVARIRALSNVEVVTGMSGKFLLGDDKCLLVIPPGGSGGVNYQTASYTALAADNGKLVSFNSASALTLTLPASPPSATWFIAVECVGAGGLTISPSGLNIDTSASNVTLAQNQGLFIYTDGANYFTQRGVGGAGAGDQYFAITTLGNNDYFTAVPITVTFPSGVLTISFGTAMSVAKYNRQRPSVGSELIDGVTITYSSYTADNTRTATDGTNTEFQVCFPRYTTVATLGLSISSSLTGTTALAFLRSQCVVKCDAIATGLVDATPAPINFEELPQRVWARRYTQ
jgi:hypothetical protein